MAIKRRLQADYWLISKDDEALDDCPNAVAYSRTYDLATVEGYLAEHPELKPTRFRCRPLDAKWHRRLDTRTMADSWAIFAEHVTAIEGLLDENGREIPIAPERVGAVMLIPDRYRDNGSIPAMVYAEIAEAIVHRGTTGDSTPFGSPDIWLGWQRTRALRNHARRADGALLVGFASATTNQTTPSSTSENQGGAPASVPSTEGGA